jgi:hypothetical protein
VVFTFLHILGQARNGQQGGKKQNNRGFLHVTFLFFKDVGLDIKNYTEVYLIIVNIVTPAVRPRAP